MSLQNHKGENVLQEAWWNKASPVCVLGPQFVMNERIKAHLNTLGPVKIKTYQQVQELNSEKMNCEVILFASQDLKGNEDKEKLAQLSSIENSKHISPDFLGLKFDRQNQFYLPILYWIEERKNMKGIHLLLASISNTTLDIHSAKDFVNKLISLETQQILAREAQLGSVHKEADVPLKSSHVRSLNLRDVKIVDGNWNSAQ